MHYRNIAIQAQEEEAAEALLLISGDGSQEDGNDDS